MSYSSSGSSVFGEDDWLAGPAVLGPRRVSGGTRLILFAYPLWNRLAGHARYQATDE